MRFIYSIVFVLLLSSCAYIDAAKRYVAVRGQDAANDALADSIWVMCNAATIGSLKRRFGNDPEGAEAYWKLCNTVYRENLVEGINEETD